MGDHRRSPAPRGRRMAKRPAACGPVVASVTPRFDLRSPPVALDALAEWFEQVSYQLVLGADFSLEDVGGAVAAFTLAVAEHSRTTDLGPREPEADEELAHVLAADHVWFSTSNEQLRWFLGVVEREDHAGHRQALGQYGRIFAEAFQRHRADERRYLERGTRPGPPARPSSPRSAY